MRDTVRDAHPPVGACGMQEQPRDAHGPGGGGGCRVGAPLPVRRQAVCAPTIVWNCPRSVQTSMERHIQPGNAWSTPIMQQLALLCRSAGGGITYSCAGALRVGPLRALKECLSKDHLQLCRSAQGVHLQLWRSAGRDHLQLWRNTQGDHLQLCRNTVPAVMDDSPGWLCLQSC